MSSAFLKAEWKQTKILNPLYTEYNIFNTQYIATQTLKLSENTLL